MIMACKTDFLKIVFDENDSVYLVRCCGFEPENSNRTYINIPKEIRENKVLLRDFIFSEAYKKPSEFSTPGISKLCHDSCEKVFDPTCGIRHVSLGLPTCNLACPTCRGAQILHVSDETINLYFNVMEAFKGCEIETFTPNLNGEPFFYKERIRKFIGSLQPNDFGVTFFISNLTTINDEDLNYIFDAASRGVLFKFFASIDSVNQDTFMKARYPSTPGMFKTALLNFDKLISHGIDVSPTITISKLNSSVEELEALGQYFSQRNVSISAVIAFGDRCKDWQELSQSQVITDWAKKYNVYLRAV